jgi:hypothetical protein
VGALLCVEYNICLVAMGLKELWASVVYKAPDVHSKLFDDPVYTTDQWSKNRSPLFRHRPEPVKWCGAALLQPARAAHLLLLPGPGVDLCARAPCSLRTVAGLFWEILYVVMIAVLVGLWQELLVVSRSCPLRQLPGTGHLAPAVPRGPGAPAAC